MGRGRSVALAVSTDLVRPFRLREQIVLEEPGRLRGQRPLLSSPQMV